MFSTSKPAVTVIIAAFNAQETIGVSVRSALAQPEVRELIVVDDASRDDTVGAAHSAAQGDERLVVLEQARNAGPAAARNRALLAARSPYVAILDSDDRFVPGRFERIFAREDWDFCADNILFSRNPADLENPAADLASSPRWVTLELDTFVAQNRSGTRGSRRELGFLKPVIRRDFLLEHKLLYDEQCRLGEDFLLYAHALALGARFRVLEACGYAALERGNSLSGNHRIADLEALLRGLEGLRSAHVLTPGVLEALDRLHRSTQERIVFRRILELRRDKGVVAGVLALVQSRSAMRDLVRDKLRRFDLEPPVRGTLLSSADFAQAAA